MRGSLAQRQLVRAGTSAIVNALGAQLFSYALGYELLAQTGSALSFGLSVLIGPLVSLVTAPGIARLIDNWSHRKTALLGNSLTIVSLLGFEGYLMLTGGRQGLLLAAVVVSIMMNVAERCFSVAYLASVQAMVPPRLVQRLNALQSVGNSTAGILAPPIAGWLFAWLPLKWILLVQLLTEIVTLWLTYQTSFDAFPVSKSTDDNSVSTAASFKTAWQFLWQEQRLGFLVIAACLLNVTYVAFEVGSPYVVMHKLHQTAATSGSIQALSSVGLILGGSIITIVTLKHIFRFALAVYVSMGFVMIVAGGLMQLPWLPLLGLFAVVNFSTGIMTALSDPPLFAYFQKAAPYALLGHLTTLMITVAQILNPIGVLIYTVLFDHVAYRSVYLGTAVVLLVSGGIMTWWFQTIKKQPVVNE